MDNIDYKNGYVLQAGNNEYYFSTEDEARVAYSDILNAINQGAKAVDVKGKNIMLSLGEVSRLTFSPSAEYIRQQYARWHSPEIAESAGKNWLHVLEMNMYRAKYFQLMVRIGENPEPVEGE